MPDHQELPVKHYELTEALSPILSDVKALKERNKERDAYDKRRRQWLLGIGTAVVILIVTAILPLIATFLAQALNGVQVK